MTTLANRIVLVAAAISVAILMLPGSSLAQVVNTVHNLTPAGTGTYKLDPGGTDQVCVFCHTPHDANDALGVALWNRATGAGYTMYPTGGTIDMTIGAQPGPISLACLSCHDGVIAFDQLYNGPTTVSGTYDYDPTAASRGWAFAGGNNDLGGAVGTDLTTDLSNDHPVGVTYDPALDTAFNTAADVQLAGLRLYDTTNDKVECGSCHNPHDATVIPFLRISNAQSQLCTTCHIK